MIGQAGGVCVCVCDEVIGKAGSVGVCVCDEGICQAGGGVCVCVR